MGAESDRLVYDYLSRVGDLAQRALPSAQRAELVARLRADIERQRSRQSDSPAAVRRILKRLGSPDAVVERAVGAPPQDRTEPAAVPPRPSEAQPDAGEAQPATGPEPPEGAEEAARQPGTVPIPAPRDGSREPDTDWWRTAKAPSETREQDEGGIPAAFTFIPDQVFFEGVRGEEDGSGPPGAGEADGQETGGAAPSAERRRWWRRRGAPGAPAAGAAAPRRIRAFGWREAAAVALLVAGTVIGSWIALLAGWVLAYYSLRLTRTEARIAAMGIPLAAAVAVWLWGRANGWWSETLPKGETPTALEDVLPVAVRVAALASAVFILWRADRRARRG